jgi:hypothetical protein
MLRYQSTIFVDGGEEMAEEVRNESKREEEPDRKCEAAQHHYWQYCVNCGTILQSRKCKLICTKCGFYHSCSEP